MKFPGKFLGIDYGTKRVGLAISDESGMLAKPLDVVSKNQALEKVISICENENIGTIIIGKSVNQEGSDNKVQNLINEFVADITMRIQLPIYFQDEAFSSHVAHGTMGKESLHAHKNKIQKAENLDAKAAAIILQRYLDKVSNTAQIHE